MWSTKGGVSRYSDLRKSPLKCHEEALPRLLHRHCALVLWRLCAQLPSVPGTCTSSHLLQTFALSGHIGLRASHRGVLASHGQPLIVVVLGHARPRPRVLFWLHRGRKAAVSIRTSIGMCFVSETCSGQHSFQAFACCGSVRVHAGRHGVLARDGQPLFTIVLGRTRLLVHPRPRAFFWELRPAKWACVPSQLPAAVLAERMRARRECHRWPEADTA